MTEVSFDKLCDSKIDIPVLPEGCSMTKAIRDAHFRIAQEALQKPPCQAGWNKNVLFGFS